jgi:hypothetical protein
LWPIAPLIIAILLSCQASQGKVNEYKNKKKTTEFGRGIETGSGIAKYNDICIWFRLFFISDEFLSDKNIRATEKSDFHKHLGLGTFPDYIVIDVEATVYKCPMMPSNQSLPPNFAASLMSDATFEVRWKTGDTLKEIDLSSLQERHKSPGLRWDYFLTVQTKDVPLNDEIVVDVILRSGLLRTRITGRLTPLS